MLVTLLQNSSTESNLPDFLKFFGGTGIFLLMAVVLVIVVIYNRIKRKK